ncbi:MAG: DUF4115 domain-containing protein [Psychromonas sp.]|nr:DUF4115 domain-containing protein [Psychromonas sp.]
MSIESEDPPNIKSLGLTLKSLRESALLSISNVSISLSIKSSIIEDIELRLDEVIDTRIYSMVFLRGYLINYAKLVGLSNLEDFTEFHKILDAKKTEIILNQPVQNFGQVKKKLHNRFFFILILIVILIVIGLTVYFIVGVKMHDKPKVASIEHIKSNYNSNMNEGSASNVVSRQNLGDVSGNKAYVDKTDRVDPDGSKSAGVKPVGVKPIENKQRVIERENIQPNAQDVQSQSKYSKNKNVSDQFILRSSPDKTIAAPMVEALKISFLKNCWTEIFDSTKKRIAYGLYKKGRIINVTGTPPFKFKLGDPSAVSIMRKGKEFTHSFPAEIPVSFQLK